MKKLILLVASGLMTSFVYKESPAPGDYFSPCDLKIDSQSNLLFIAGRTALQIRSFHLDDLKAVSSFSTELPPKAIEVAGDNLLVACSHSMGELIVLDKFTLAAKARIQTGHGACDIAVSSDLSRAYVANQFSNDISVIDLDKGKEINRIAVLRQAMQVEISGDGAYLFVANFLPDGRADVDSVSSKVTVIDLRTEKSVKHISLANGSNALRGMCSSADGNYILITHNLGRFQVPTTQLEQGWMNTSALSVIDARSLEFIATVLLDEPDFGAPGSWGLDCSEEDIFVTHSGTHDFSRIDYASFIGKLMNHPDREALAYDLHFLPGIRERFKLVGNGPRALTYSENLLYVVNYFSDNLNIVDLALEAGSEIQQIDLSIGRQMDQARLGEMYFNDASFCFQSWQSCNGCHPNEARVDGLNWDLLNDGMGNPKNCKSMLLAHKTPPSMITGIRPDAETAVKAGFEHIQFTIVDQEISSAVDVYLESLEAIPSPLLKKGRLSPAARKGRDIFVQIGCGDCHSGPWFTDLSQHTMGTQGAFDHQNTWDTPSLIEVWRTGPYLHDGRCATMEDVFTTEKHGIDNSLSEKATQQLVEYVLSL